MATYYEILGVQKDATIDEIKAAFRRKALAHHPDKNNNNQDASASEFSKIKEAYDVLSQPIKRSIYDDNQHSVVPSFMNDILVQIFVMASRPRVIVVKLEVPFEEVYQKKIKRIEIKVKRWVDHSYVFYNEVFHISLINVQDKYAFEGMGDDSIIPTFPRGDVEIQINITNYSEHLKIDRVFSEHDLFLTVPMSLYTFYNEAEFDLELCPNIKIKRSNDRKLSYHMLNVGLPTGVVTRSDIYIEIQLIMPLKLKTGKSKRLQHVLKKYFS